MTPSKDELIKFIAKEISYDGDLAQKEIKCSKCGHIVQREVINHWIDHKSALAGNISFFLKFKCEEQVYRILENAYVTGKADEDASSLTNNIFSELFYDSPEAKENK